MTGEFKRSGSTRAWRRVRAAVLAASDVCHLCGRAGADSVDHVVPLKLGGAYLDPRNLAPAHLACNLRKGAGPGAKTRTSRAW